MTEKEDRCIPDNLSLLLRSSRPEAQDYVANLDQDKYKSMKKILTSVQVVRPQ